ncbi:hypothetical protein [Phaeovulum sp.]|uniref:hypothetical protein n=1 Tax=Phaeovulum sp. TaxID=2934796 RepID=UPI00272F026B|nr:hypothetical protein [Phaeovulum sp.]MDP1667890.1 hypothetical protein [Phaeovulum sp.]MDZ4117680.1 hypothetical protein [Phaeovulum sp.]
MLFDAFAIRSIFDSAAILELIFDANEGFSTDGYAATDAGVIPKRAVAGRCRACGLGSFGRFPRGELGRKRRDGEFAKLTDDEVELAEGIVKEAFDGSVS